MIKKLITTLLITTSMATAAIAYEAEVAQDKADARCGILALDALGLRHIESYDGYSKWYSKTTDSRKALIVVRSVQTIDNYISSLVQEGLSPRRAINEFYKLKDKTLRDRNLIKQLKLSNCGERYSYKGTK